MKTKSFRIFSAILVLTLAGLIWTYSDAQTSQKKEQTFEVLVVGTPSKKVESGMKTLEKGSVCTLSELKKVKLKKGEYMKVRNCATRRRISVVPSNQNSTVPSGAQLIVSEGTYTKGVKDLEKLLEGHYMQYMTEDTLFIPARLKYDDEHWVSVRPITNIYERKSVILQYDDESYELILTRSNLEGAGITMDKLDGMKFHMEYHTPDTVVFITNDLQINYILPK